MIAILVMPANGDSRFLKIKVFRNKGCDVLTSSTSAIKLYLVTQIIL